MGGIEQVMAARAAILARAAAIAGEAGAAGAAVPAAPTGFAALFERALDRAAASARAASAATSAFERGESDDIAQVMLARQVASVEFEATLQLRNRLLGAYRDIMNMPV